MADVTTRSLVWNRTGFINPFLLNQRPISALKTQGQPAPANIKSVQGWLQPPGAGCLEVISSIVAKIEMANTVKSRVEARVTIQKI